MSKQKSNNEAFDQQMNDLSLPDGEQSWQKMKQLLEDDDRKRRIIPPVLLRTCAGWGALLLLALAATWLIVRPEKWWQENEIANQKENVEKQKQDLNNSTKTLLPVDLNSKSKPNTDRSILDTTSKDNSVVSLKTENTIPPIIIQNDATAKVKVSNEKIRIKQSGNVNKKKGVIDNSADGEKRVARGETEDDNTNDRLGTKADTTNQSIPGKRKNIASADSLVVIQTTPVDKITLPQDSAKAEDVVANEKKEQGQKKSRKFIFSAGLGLQQQIPLNGQSGVPYNYYGRKGSLSDYIPSAYFKIEKEKQWFIMGEFRYGAPQSLKEFSYNRQTKFDTTTNNITTTTLRLKKTYYHQLPVSFNYYLKPNWSVGAGGIYSRFYGAVTEREVNSRNIQTQAETVTKQISRIQNFTDSFLYKTQVHFLLQTNYQWKRFNFSLRYTKDLQPYIRYTKPDGAINEEKNQSLQFIVRYRLWQ